jgi:hypothetical protein
VPKTRCIVSKHRSKVLKLFLSFNNVFSTARNSFFIKNVGNYSLTVREKWDKHVDKKDVLTGINDGQNAGVE